MINQLTVSELIEYLRSAVGQTIRGRVVEDCDVSISIDGSATITAWLGPQRNETRIIQRDRGTEQLFAIVDDVSTITDLHTLRWEWPDEGGA